MKNTVLLVDDDPIVLQVTSILLRSLGHNYILMARNASEALGIWHSHKDEIGRLLTDINMPGLSGDELAAELLQADPGLEAFFMSGNPPDLLNSKIPLRQGLNFIQKPFTPQELGLVLGRTRPCPTSRKERSFYAFASQS
jgi:CheY-like chemotaxis protein